MVNCKTLTGLAIAMAVAGVPLVGSGQAGTETLTSQDHDEIRQLYARYAHTIDTGDAEGWANTFTDDGIFGNARGRAALVEFVHTVYKQNQELGRQSRHWNNQILIEPTAEGARGSCYLVLYNTGVSPPVVRLTGVYRDTLVRTPQGWRFQGTGGRTRRSSELNQLPTPWS